jgi:hypothetical protein
MLSEYIKTTEMLAAHKDYIKNCSKHAARAYKNLKLKYEMFEGTSLELSPTMCEGIYSDLLGEMVKTNCLIGNKFGLTATIIPLQERETNTIFFNVNLGIIFPDMVE